MGSQTDVLLGSQMEVLLGLFDSVESNMETICTLATDIHIPQDIIGAMGVAKLSVVKCKSSLVSYVNNGEERIKSEIKSEALCLQEMDGTDLLDGTQIALKLENKSFEELESEYLDATFDPSDALEETDFNENGDDFVVKSERKDKPKKRDSKKARGDSNLCEECRVCGAPAAEHLHYGAICCFSCRAYFRRGRPQNKCIFKNDVCQINEKTRTQCRSCRYNKCIQVGMIPAMVDIKTPKKNGDDDSEEKTRHKDDNDEDYDPNDDVKTENKMDTSDTPIDYNEDGENDDMLEDEDYMMPEKKKKKVKAKAGVRRQKELTEECGVCTAPAPSNKHYGAITCFSCRAFFRRGRPGERCNNNSRCKLTKLTKAGCPPCRYSKCIAIGMIPEQVKTNKNPRKNLASDDVSILDDWMDNDPAFNDNPDDDNDQENDVKQAEMEKPEEPTLQSKAETFVEFMKTVKKNDNLVLQDVVQALEAENYHLFSYVKEKNGVVKRHCSICTANAELDPNHIKNHFNFNACRSCGLWLFQFQSPRHNEQKHLKRCRFCCRYLRDMDKHKCPFRVISSGLKCEICGESFKKPAYLVIHKREKHRSSAFHAICDICGRNDFKSKKTYWDHMKKHTTLAYPCNLCPAVYKTKYKLLTHKDNEHTDVLGQFCDLCGIVVPSLSRHNYFKHKPQNCEICSKEFGNKHTLNKHIKLVHEQSLRVQCAECNKEFSCRAALTKHNRNVHKINLKKKSEIATMKDEGFY